MRLNTDAIDNSAGVNSSDVEVNIKIALDHAGARRTPRRRTQRNALLADMTDEVAALVLRNNYLQTLALSLSEQRGLARSRLRAPADAHARRRRAGSTARSNTCPTTAALAERARRGEALTRPELAVLLAYAKLSLHDELLESPVPDDPYLGKELERYFPAEMRERFPDAIASHRLRREIIATQLANAIINRGGPTMVARLVDQTGADAPTIAAAYAATRDSFGLTEMNAAIDALDGMVPGQVQLRLYGELQDLLMNRIVWFIRNVDFANHSLDEIIGTYQAGIAEVERSLDEDAVARMPWPHGTRARRRSWTKARRRSLPGASRRCPIWWRRPTSCRRRRRPASPLPTSPAPISRSRPPSGSARSSARRRRSPSAIISTGWRSTAPSTASPLPIAA